MQFTRLIPFLLSIYFCQSESIVRRFEIIDKNANRSEYVENRTVSENGDSPELYAKCEDMCNLKANPMVKCLLEPTGVVCKCFHMEYEFDYEEKVCKKCVCGENTEPCRLEDGNPKCDCLKEFYLVDGNCTALSEKCKTNCNLPVKEGDVKCEEDKLEDMCLCTGNGKMFDYHAKDCKQCVCGNNTEPCKIEGGKPKCDCLTGYRLINGNCEKEEALSEKCKETCNLPANEGDVRCDEGKREDMCVCTENGKMFDYDAKDCKECVCGANTKPCRIVVGIPKCECLKGYELENGNCEEELHCHCGKYSSGCSVGKVCDSLEGYSENKGTCEGRYCGHADNGTCQLRRRVTCYCLLGYSQNNETCEKCDCGPGGICQFANGKKVCHCPERHSEINGICAICDCGRYAYGCYFDGGYKKCSCIPGFNQVDGICRNDTCTTDEDCHNGATCFRDKCKCLPRTTGPRCQVVNCNSVDPRCRLSGGSCQYDVSSRNVFCKCKEPKTYNTSTGRCEDPCLVGRCQNGGTCIVLGNTFKCLCRASFTGEMCENDTQNMKLALWISCSTVAVLVIIVGITLFIRCQKR